MEKTLKEILDNPRAFMLVTADELNENKISYIKAAQDTVNDVAKIWFLSKALFNDRCKPSYDAKTKKVIKENVAFWYKCNKNMREDLQRQCFSDASYLVDNKIV